MSNVKEVRKAKDQYQKLLKRVRTDEVKKFKTMGFSNSEISEITNLPESTIRIMLKEEN